MGCGLGYMTRGAIVQGPSAVVLTAGLAGLAQNCMLSKNVILTW